MVAPRQPPARTFVDRARETALLGHLLAEARDGHPAVVVVSGVPGAGKTALARWITDEVDDGALILRTSCSAGSPPLAAIRQLVRSTPDLVARVGEAGADAEQVALELADGLLARARWRTVLVVVDDVHLVDRASEAVLDQLVMAVDDAALGQGPQLLVVLVTVEPLLDDGVASRALRLDVTRAISVGGLDEHDVFDLAIARGRRPDPEHIRRVHEDTGGLPLLVEAQLDATDAGAALRVRTIADAVRARLNGLDPNEVELLRIASVLGDPWTLDEVDEVATALGSAATTTEVLGPLVERLRGADVLTTVGGAHQFRHPLVRAEVLADLDPNLRRRMHALAARSLEARGSSDDLVLRAAAHWVRAGDEVDDAELVRTAELAVPVAMRWHAWHLAGSLARAAAASCERAGDDVAVARWLIEAGRAGHYAHDLERIEADLTAALVAADHVGDAHLHLDAAVLLARAQLTLRSVSLGQRIDTSALESAIAAADAADASDALLVDAESLLADVRYAAGEHELALASIAGTRRRSERSDLTGAVDGPRCRVEVAEGLHLLAVLDLPGAEQAFTRAEAFARSSSEPQTIIGTASRRQYTRLMQGHVAESLAALPDLVERAVSKGIWSEACFAAAQLAFARTLAGRPDAAIAVDQARRWHRRSDYTWGELLAAQAATALDARHGTVAGDPGARRSSVVEALVAVEAHDPSRVREVIAGARWRTGVRGQLVADSMGVAVALVEVADLLDDPALARSAIGPLTAAYERGTLVAFGWPALVPRVLATAARLDGDLDTARRSLHHAAGLAERDGLDAELARLRLERAQVDAVAGVEGDELRDQLAACLTAFDALGHHGWVARTEAIANRAGIALVASIDGLTRERTIFTTDIVGSTEANARLGDALYLEQLRIHDRIVRSRLRELRGVEIKHTGDGINASFDDAGDAVRCALAVQRDVAGWLVDAPDRALAVRFGLAKGRLIASEGDYYGLVQSEAARLCAMADPGTVLVTRAIVDSAGVDAERFHALGARSLRGLPDPVEVYAVVPEI